MAGSSTSLDEISKGIATMLHPSSVIDDDCGPNPTDLFGKYTWKLDRFSYINKNEVRSNSFVVGGHKWYILIYPNGCHVCNHLSLFLCVANHDQLLPGWGHYAVFTACVVNKDPKRTRYSDTMHLFWNKEHDWGWKKFMESTKLSGDGFINDDTLTIKVQVQVFREIVARPFRCLDSSYRRELTRVYSSNIQNIFHTSVEEKKELVRKLTEDQVKWSSFCDFWSGIGKKSRRQMSAVKMDSVLRMIVNVFFKDKEVTTALVMESLYEGLKALKNKEKCDETEEEMQNIVRLKNDSFVLVDDVLLLLKRVVLETLAPKDEYRHVCREDDLEHDVKTLAELGRKTIEIFILSCIFSKIEAEYNESVALKRQEELIREEEEAGAAKNQQKGKRFK